MEITETGKIKIAGLEKTRLVKSKCEMRMDYKGENLVLSYLFDEALSCQNQPYSHDIYVYDIRKIGNGETILDKNSCKRILSMQIHPHEGRFPGIRDFLYLGDLFWICLGDRAYVYRIDRAGLRLLKDLPLRCLSLGASEEESVSCLTEDGLYIFDAKGESLRKLALRGFHFDLRSSLPIFRSPSGADHSPLHFSFIQHDIDNNIILFGPGFIMKYSEQGELLCNYYWPASQMDSKWRHGMAFILAGTVDRKEGDIHCAVNQGGRTFWHVLDRDLEHKDTLALPMRVIIDSMECDKEGNLYYSYVAFGKDGKHLKKAMPEIIRCRVENIAMAGKTGEFRSD